MSEMKIWVTPEVQVQIFQANEYVSLCYVSNPAGALNSDWWQDLLKWLGSLVGWDPDIATEAYFYKDASGNNIMLSGSAQDTIGSDSDHNKGTLYDVYYGTRTYENGAWSEWNVEKNPIDGLNAFEPANQKGTYYVGAFRPQSTYTTIWGQTRQSWS